MAVRLVSNHTRRFNGRKVRLRVIDNRNHRRSPIFVVFAARTAREKEILLSVLCQVVITSANYPTF